MTTLTKLPARPRAKLARIELPPLPDWCPPETVRSMGCSIFCAAQPPGPRTDLRPLKAVLWALVDRATWPPPMPQDDVSIILGHMAAEALDTMADYRR